MAIIEHPNKNYFMDNYLYSNLSILKDTVKKDWDVVIEIDGYEGSGKSSLAQQIAYFFDPTFNIDRIAFNHIQFKKIVLSASKYQVIVFDESYADLSSTTTIKTINRTLCNMMSQIRQNNLFIIIVAPSFFDITRYIAIHRSRVLLHVYTHEKFERGYFACYTYNKKKILYLIGKKLYNYGVVKPDFTGKFPSCYTVDETEYRKRKYDSKNNMSIDEDEGIAHYKTQRNSLIMSLHEGGVDVNKILENLNKYSEVPLGAMAIYKIIRNMKKFIKNEAEDKQNGESTGTADAAIDGN